MIEVMVNVILFYFILFFFFSVKLYKHSSIHVNNSSNDTK